MEGAAGVATVSPAAAGPAEGEAEDGEILDQATAAVGVDVGVGVGRGLDADAGEAGSVRGVLPAPVCSEPPSILLPLVIGYFRYPLILCSGVLNFHVVLGEFCSVWT